MQMCCRVSFAALLGLLATHAATAATLFVPANFPTIQDAVAAASSGDTIVVAPGTYTEQIDLLGKSLVLQASGDANNTIISGFASPIIRASNANNVVLRGFTHEAGHDEPTDEYWSPVVRFLKRGIGSLE